ncbi:jupiter microtubule associated homolog 1-like isoform X1 [Brienomyrus brachyistius]|uniref:jupiter microtubule associated homolog 1-like isoform X1 n=1 Tax=Brienomyrus brachyistius TaxID=42636 RepID=UPI0020B24788|nr:jupiter microtubule associated homolog 1-like isoform X1 [Brienomyrus brachyistius]
MTTTTTFQGMDPSSKNSSRVLCPPGGASNISFGMDEDKSPTRKNRMASNIFAEPVDPHAHRRNNPPGGKASGVLCGEPSAPLRRCHQQTAQKNSISEAPTLDGEREDAEAEYAEEGESAEEPKDEEAPQPSPPTVPAPSPMSRKNPPGGKSSLILG